MEEKNSQTLSFLQELTLCYFVLLTELDKFLTICIQAILKIRLLDSLCNFVEEKSLRGHLLSAKGSKPSFW